MNILVSNAIEIGQIANDRPSHWIWIIGCVAILLGLLIIAFEEGCFGGVVIAGGIIAIISFFVIGDGTHLENAIPKIEKAYSVEVLNKDKLLKDIENANEFSPIELSYRTDDGLYYETVLVYKEEVRSKRDDLQSYSFEIFSGSDSDKVKAVPFESCNIELCPDGVRKFK